MNLNNNYFLLRHGQTIYQKENRGMNYEPDSPQKLEITEEGKEMIKKSAEELKDKKIDLIFASPFLRTRQSAEIAANILGIDTVNYDERLIDLNVGEFAGKTFEEYKNFFKSDREKFFKRPKGGDNWDDIISRFKSFLSEVEKKYKDKNILIVSHGDPVWLMAGVLRGFSKEEEFLATRKTQKNNLYPKVGDLIIP